MFYVKPDVSSSKPFESYLKSRAVKIFAKPNNRIVPIGNVFGSQYKWENSSKMQEISLMKKSIHWFMNDMVVKRGHQDHLYFYPFGTLESYI